MKKNGFTSRPRLDNPRKEVMIEIKGKELPGPSEFKGEAGDGKTRFTAAVYHK
jgi:hypothetical protein